MGKLIELLNKRLSTSDLYDFYDKIYYKEYCGGNVVKIMARIRDKFKPTGDRDADMTHLICLKKYEFIKWLVEENKIDKSKYERILDRIEYYSQSEEEQEIHYYSDVDSLLMLLSISDTPIDDLISYLK